MYSNPKPSSETGTKSAWRVVNRPYVHVLILIFLAIACYSNTFHVPMLLDDEGSIQLHTPVHGLANYFKDWAGYNFLPNRAFGYLTFALNYEFGGLNVTGFHLVNLVIHIGTALLVYALVVLTFRTPYLRHDDDEVAADALNLLLNADRGAGAHGHHRDHRGHADDDAERGQRRSEDVAADLTNREDDCVQNHHRHEWYVSRRSSLST